MSPTGVSLTENSWTSRPSFVLHLGCNVPAICAATAALLAPGDRQEQRRDTGLALLAWGGWGGGVLDPDY